MLYSIGKDSSVMLHLADEGLPSPSSRRFRCCVDTTWKFREMIEFSRDHGAAPRPRSHRPCQPEALALGINPSRLAPRSSHGRLEDPGPEAGSR
jgi:sulfate adenylyltransferase subunit 2